MKRWESRIVPGGLLVAGLVFIVAALRPILSDSSLNVPFLLIGIVCAVGGLVLWRRIEDAPPSS